MDAAQRAGLEEDGYLVLRGVLSAEESAHLSSLFDRELARLPLEQQASAAGNVYSLRADGSSTRSGEVEDAAAVAVAEPVEDSSVQLEMPRSERGKRIFHSAVHRSLIDRPEVMGILEELCGVRSRPAFPVVPEPELLLTPRFSSRSLPSRSRSRFSRGALLGQSPQWAHAVPSIPREARHRVRLDFDQMHYKPPCVDGVADGGGGFHGNPNRLHITCVYEVSSVGPGDGGFSYAAQRIRFPRLCLLGVS